MGWLSFLSSPDPGPDPTLTPAPPDPTPPAPAAPALPSAANPFTLEAYLPALPVNPFTAHAPPQTDTHTQAALSAPSPSSPSPALAQPSSRRPLTEDELARFASHATNEAALDRSTPAGYQAHLSSPEVAFVRRQAEVNCSDLVGAFRACADGVMPVVGHLSGKCEGLRRMATACVDEQESLLKTSGFGRQANTLQQNLYLAALADWTGQERRAALDAALHSASSPATIDQTRTSPSSSSSTSTTSPLKEGSGLGPLLRRELPRLAPDKSHVEWATERRARERAELDHRRQAVEGRLVKGDLGWTGWVKAKVEQGRLGWDEWTWEGGRGMFPTADSGAQGEQKEKGSSAV